jgi:hypothetical protein
MADEITNSGGTSPAASPAAAPVEPVAAAAPPGPAAAAPAAGTTAPAASIEPAAPAAAEIAPAREPNLLEKVDAERADAAKAAKTAEAAEPVKPEPAKTAESVKTAEGKTAEAAKVEPDKPVEYKFEIPEFIKKDDPRIGAYTDILRENGVSPEIGQKFLAMHAEALGEYAKHTLASQISSFENFCRDQEKLVMADPEFGGAGFNTAKQAVARARDALISSAQPGSQLYAQHMKEFNDFNRATGAGSHPAFWRMLHNAARFIDEPQASGIPTDIRPSKANGRAPKPSIYSEESQRKMGG